MSEQGSRLQHFPPSFFAMVMGLGGLSIAWIHAFYNFGITPLIGLGLLGFTTMVFVMILVPFLLKWKKYPQEMKADFKHPIKVNFFPTVSISLVILAIGWKNVLPDMSHALFILGASLHILFTLKIVSSWMHHEHYKIEHMNASWFIPAVGNILMPLVGVHFGYIEISWFFFSVGFMLWIILVAIVFNRIFFHDPLPAMLIPTFFILIAPPAVGFMSYLALNGGEIDAFARILYFSALFLTLLLATQWKAFTKLQFTLSWWAYSFPTAAITIATMVMLKHNPTPFYEGLSYALLGFLSVLIVLLLSKTFIAIAHKRICQPH